MKLNDHGAETSYIYKAFGVEKPMKVIDFSTNTNVVKLRHNMDAQIKNLDLSAYPDTTNSKVIDKISLNIEKESHKKINKENILVTNGSNEAIYIIASYFANKEVAILQPTYPEYEKAFKAYDAKVNNCFNLEELLSKTYKCVCICNPNNPTGTYIKWPKLVELLKQLEDIGTTVLIDEAYIDFLLYEDQEARDKYDYCTKKKNLILLRSLTKIYQIAGLRLGYLIGHEDWIDLIKKRQPSWSVNSLASLVADEYLGDQTIVTDTKAFYRDETKRVICQLRDMKFEVMETTVNFYLIKIADDIKLIKYLLSCGIIVRHTRNHPGLDGNYVRIAVRSVEDNNYLIKSLETYSQHS